MIRFKPSRLTAAIALSAVVIVLAGGGAVASNMGFKMNKALFGRAAGQASPVGDNWVSLPYNKPYSCYSDLCTQAALPNGTTLFQRITESGAPQSCVCGVGTACTRLALNLDNVGACGGVAVPLVNPDGVAHAFGDGPKDPYYGIRINNNAFFQNAACTGAGTPVACCTGAGGPFEKDSEPHELRGSPFQ